MIICGEVNSQAAKWYILPRSAVHSKYKKIVLRRKIVPKINRFRDKKSQFFTGLIFLHLTPRRRRWNEARTPNEWYAGGPPPPTLFCLNAATEGNRGFSTEAIFHSNRGFSIATEELFLSNRNCYLSNRGISLATEALPRQQVVFPHFTEVSPSNWGFSLATEVFT